MTTYFEDRLKKMDTAFRSASADESGYGFTPPDGDYQATVQRFDFFEGKAADSPLFLKTEMTIASGDHRGATVEAINRATGTPEQLSWTKKHLTALGLEVDPYHELESRLGDAVGSIVEIRIKRSQKTREDGSPYVNVYVNRLIRPPGATDVPSDWREQAATGANTDAAF